MQLKSIKLENFRQYRDGKIEFSTNPERNITLVVGEMGFGKTTLEQAFRYVLYGIAEFSNNELLNNIVKRDMPINKSETSSVTLDFKYKNKEYSLKRSQIYHKFEEDRITAQKSSLKLFQIIGGNFIPQKDELALKIANQMIPYQLSDYFFADGEKIEKMSKKMKNNEKQDDFANVVKSLLGLNHFTNAIKHLKSIEKQYKKDISRLGGNISERIYKEINHLELQQETIEKETKLLSSQFDEFTNSKNSLDQEIRMIPDAEKLQSEFVEKKKSLELKINELDRLKIEYLGTTNNNFFNYISAPLIKKSLDALKNKGEIDFGVPGLQGNTVNYILKSGTCLCGTSVDKSDEIKKRLEYLLTTVPPHSSGLAISQFVKESKLRVESQMLMYKSLQSGYKAIREKNSEIDSLSNEISNLEEHMGNITSIVDKISKYKYYELKINETRENISVNDRKIGVIQQEIYNKNKELKDQLIKSEATEKTNEYLEYVQFLIDQINDVYTQKEEVIRKELEDNLNYHLHRMYKKGFTIEINDKYRLKINVDGSVLNDNLDKSSGQGFMIIFAFISSIVKMAKEKNNDQYNLAESYPLVFDAPLSNIDEPYIPKFANVVSDIAEQAIIFLNRKDTQILKKTSSDKIGKEYELAIISDLETSIREVQ